MNRRIDKCTSCGKERKIAAHSLCFACYRQIERTIKRKRGAEAIVQPDDKRLLRVYVAAINNLVEMGVSREDILAIKRSYLDPCVSSVAVYLNISSEERE